MLAYIKLLVSVLAFCFLLTTSGESLGETSYGNARAVVVSVRDGDTLTVDIAGWPPLVGERIGVRLAGVNTPELRAKDPAERERAQSAKAFTASLAPPGTVIELRNIRRGKYFRIVAEVYVNGKNLSEQIIKQIASYGYIAKQQIQN